MEAKKCEVIPARSPRLRCVSGDDAPNMPRPESIIIRVAGHPMLYLPGAYVHELDAVFRQLACVQLRKLLSPSARFFDGRI